MTTFPIADQQMEAQVRRAMESDVGGKRPISRGPYVYLNRAFKPGPSLQELFQQKEAALHPALPGLFPFIPTLHAHQAKALASIGPSDLPRKKPPPKPTGNTGGKLL